jgi:glycosyltransferase involved in cell wall biosynthesis
MDAHLATRLAASVLGTVFFLAPTRFEKNEGQRSYNLALGLSRRGWKVVFAYWRWRNDGERPQAVRPGDVLEVPLDVLLADPEEGLKKVPPGRGLVLLEFPVPASYRFLASANAHGHATVYDAVDDWQAFRDAGQAPWYDEAFERGLARSCDTVVAVSPTLARIVGGRCDRQVHLVPNAWSEDLLDGEARVSPERGTTTVGYFGHLTEAWFDWDLLLACARLRPDWRFHLIGYGGGWHTTRLPENVLYHGKLPRSALAGHAAGWDVALIPFRKGQVAAGADPIKIYEYLGLGLPVVGSGVHPPVGAEALVTIADTPSEIVRAIEAALSAPGDGPSERRAFAAANTWDRRIEALLRIVETAEPRASLKRRLFEALT